LIVSGLPPIGFWAMAHPQKNFIKIGQVLIYLIHGETDRQTNKQTDVKT